MNRPNLNHQEALKIIRDYLEEVGLSPLSFTREKMIDDLDVLYHYEAVDNDQSTGNDYAILSNAFAEIQRNELVAATERIFRSFSEDVSIKVVGMNVSLEINGRPGSFTAKVNTNEKEGRHSILFTGNVVCPEGKGRNIEFEARSAEPLRMHAGNNIYTIISSHKIKELKDYLS